MFYNIDYQTVIGMSMSHEWFKCGYSNVLNMETVNKRENNPGWYSIDDVPPQLPRSFRVVFFKSCWKLLCVLSKIYVHIGIDRTMPSSDPEKKISVHMHSGTLDVNNSGKFAN